MPSAQLGEFFVKLGISTDSKALTSFRQTIGQIPTDVAEAVLAISGIGFGVANLSQHILETAASFRMFESTTSLSSQELQKWQIAAEHANVSARTVASSIESLQRNLFNIATGRGNMRGFAWLQIDNHLGEYEILKELRKKIHQFSRPYFMSAISDMGLSPEMAQVFLLSEKEFERVNKKFVGLTKEQVDSLNEVKTAFKDLGLQILYFFSSYAQPVMEATLHSRGFRIVLASLAAAAIAAGVALGTISVPVLAISASIAALVVALADLAKFFTGKDSVTGSIIKNVNSMYGKTPSVVGESIVSAYPMLAPLRALGGAVFNIDISSSATSAEELAENIKDALSSSLEKVLGKSEQTVYY